MKKYLLYLVAVFIIFSGKLIAQRTCASFELLQQQLKNNPEFAKKFHENEQKVQAYAAKNGASARNTPITIPLIVHVVYHTAEQDITDAQVLSQLDVLNEDYSATNSDYNN